MPRKCRGKCFEGSLTSLHVGPSANNLAFMGVPFDPVPYIDVVSKWLGLVEAVL